MSEVQWQGGCELKDEVGTRIGNLYVTETDIFFIEAGRGGLTQYRPALALLALAGALLGIPVAAEIYAWTWNGGARMGLVVVIEVLAAVGAVGCVALAARVAATLKQVYEDGLRALSATDSAPPRVSMLEAASETVSGSLRLPMNDVDEVRRAEGRVHLETRLGEKWDLLILPNPDSFMAAVIRPSL